MSLFGTEWRERGYGLWPLKHFNISRLANFMRKKTASKTDALHAPSAEKKRPAAPENVFWLTFPRTCFQPRALLEYRSTSHHPSPPPPPHFYQLQQAIFHRLYWASADQRLFLCRREILIFCSKEMRQKKRSFVFKNVYVTSLFYKRRAFECKAKEGLFEKGQSYFLFYENVTSF